MGSLNIIKLRFDTTKYQFDIKNNNKMTAARAPLEASCLPRTMQKVTIAAKALANKETSAGLQGGHLQVAHQHRLDCRGFHRHEAKPNSTLILGK